jgi:hypothetical protein
MGQDTCEPLPGTGWQLSSLACGRLFYPESLRVEQDQHRTTNSQKVLCIAKVIFSLYIPYINHLYHQGMHTGSLVV